MAGRFAANEPVESAVPVVPASQDSLRLPGTHCNLPAAVMPVASSPTRQIASATAAHPRTTFPPRRAGWPCCYATAKPSSAPARPTPNWPRARSMPLCTTKTKPRAPRTRCAPSPADDFEICHVRFEIKRSMARKPHRAPCAAGEEAGTARAQAPVAEDGFTILTWNGVGFDFDVLAEESGESKLCRQLASEHVDMMFHILCRLGFGVSLDSAARGMGIEGKDRGLNSASAPVLWGKGMHEDVFKYVERDVRTTLASAGTIQLERESTVWRACGDETKSSSRTSTGGGPNGAPAN